MGHSPTIRRHGAEQGFTLLELLIAIAVAAILLAVAVPSYQGLVQRNSLTANVNDLVGDLNYARSEAVTRGQDVYICSSNDQSNCNAGTDWSKGWVVYAATDPSASSPNPTPDNRLRVRGKTAENFGLSGGIDSLHFTANGFAASLTSFTATADDVARATKLTVSATGRVKISHEDNT